MTETTTPDKKESKKNKKKGPIRFEAIIPVAVISLITFVYFTYYFDHHMKKLIEYVGTQANGAEVNVDSVRTSFLKASFNLDRLQVTDAERPTLNSLEVGNMHFQYLWDALLRMKFVVEDASITDIKLLSKRSSPGKVLPPKPASPSKMEALQAQVIAQVKNKYGGNVLGDAIKLLEGGDYKEQIQSIRGSLKSESAVQTMITDVNTKKAFWDGKVKELSDTTKLKEIETTLAEVRAEKNILNQAKGVQKLNDLLKEVNKQYKEIEKSSKSLQAEVKMVSAYPNQLQAMVKEDIASLKDHFKIPKIDFKEMAMHLFAGEFAEYIAKARKYQALAKQYIPEKKEEQDVVVPRKRSEGKNYQFPITTGYPLFWLKRAAISSKGTADSYSGQVSGELTNVTTSPKQIGKPIVLDMRGDFPGVQVMGVKAVLTADFTRDVGRQSALIQVNSFAVPEKLFVNDGKTKFGFKNATGSSTISAQLEEQNVKMHWTSALTKPQFVVDSQSKIAKEMLTNILNNIPVININGSATGQFSNLNMDITSNLGDELGSGFSRELTAKVDEAQAKIQTLIDEKINKPKEQLMAAISGNNKNLSSLGNLQDLYKNNEDKIQAEIDKIKKGGTGGLKEQGKKLLKGFKF
jgi:uncharacterized protein (TIGR03545 family)